MTGLFDISWGFIALVTWGVADYLARYTSARIGSYSASLFIQALGTLLPAGLLAIEWTVGGVPRDVDWRFLAYTVPLASALMAVAYTVYYTGLERGSVSIVTGVASAWLLVSVLIAVLAFREPVDLVQGTLIAVILSGIVLISVRSATRHGRPSGFVYGLAAMLFMGAAFAMWKPIAEAGGPMLAVFLVRAVSSAGLWVYLRMRGAVLLWPSSGATLWVLVAAAVLDAMGFVAYNIGVERAPLTVIAPLGAASPAATILLAVFLLHERPSALQTAGIALTLVGVVALSAIVGR